MFRGTTYTEGNEAVYVGPCVGGCGKTFEVRQPIENHIRRLRGAHAQDAYPELGTDWREFLISNTCPHCWQELFGGDDEIVTPDCIREIEPEPEPEPLAAEEDGFGAFLRSLLPQPGMSYTRTLRIKIGGE